VSEILFFRRAHSRGMATAADERVDLEAMQRGDAAAWLEVVDQWLPIVLGWCTRLGGPGVVPEDAAQDVLIVAWRRVSALRDLDGLGPWLYAITRRTLAAHRRRAWVRRWNPFSGDPASSTPGPARLYEVNETGLAVQRVLERIPPTEREVLVLSLLEERADSEVAAMLGIPKGTVKSRLRRARIRFLAEAEAAGLRIPTMEEP
jgi:RNA polymerase sigma factor (sigma-70 family)